MKFDTVIFDLDGTLLDTLDDIFDSANELLEGKGYPLRNREEIRSFVGNGVEVLVRKSLPDGTGEDEIRRCVEEYLPIYKKNMNNHTRPYDGVMELLEALRGRGVRMAVVSNKPDKSCVALVRDLFGEYISVAIGNRPDVERKPARASVDWALEKLGADGRSAVYVGDSEVDALTARNAGIPCVGVTWGFRDRDVFEKEGVEYIIDEPGELLGIVE